MKILCETTGAFQLVDYGNQADVICHDRPSVAVESSFTSGHAAGGRLRVLGSVSDEATDQEFAAYLKDSDGDVKLAIESFLVAYSPDAKPVEAPKPASKPKGK